jgi:allophanate hydrolase
MCLLFSGARVEWDKIDVLMTPTALHHYTVEELERDEKLAETANGAKNSNLGKFTNYMNLLDCCAIAVPSGLITECVEANKVQTNRNKQNVVSLLSKAC